MKKGYIETRQGQVHYRADGETGPYLFLLHLTPFSFGHWELLRRDNLPSRNALPELLGRAPHPVVPPPGHEPCQPPRAVPADA